THLSVGATSIGAFTLNVTGANSYSLGLGATTLTGAATFNPTTASVAIASITAVDKNLTLGGTASGNTVGAITTGTGSLTKSGTSTWTLTGTTTYTGATNVNAGTLNITGILDNTAVTVGAGTLALNHTGAISQNSVTLNNSSSVLTENATNA